MISNKLLENIISYKLQKKVRRDRHFVSGVYSSGKRSPWPPDQGFYKSACVSGRAASPLHQASETAHARRLPLGIATC
jgi:hypothetical protein